MRQSEQGICMTSLNVREKERGAKRRRKQAHAMFEK